MTHKKLLELFTRYEKFITEKFLNIDAARMRIDLPVHENPTDLYRHLLWMCGQGKLFVEDLRYEKAFRWLGFLQGALFTRGNFSIAELGEHAKPPERPYSTEYVDEARRFSALSRDARIAADYETRFGCGHKNAAGESRVFNDACTSCGRRPGE